MSSRIIVYKSVLIAWFLLSGTIGYVVLKKSEALCGSLRNGESGILDKILKGNLVGEGVFIDQEGFDRWISSKLGKPR